MLSNAEYNADDKISIAGYKRRKIMAACEIWNLKIMTKLGVMDCITATRCFPIQIEGWRMRKNISRDKK